MRRRPARSTAPPVPPPARLEVLIYTLRCGSCAHQTSALDEDRTAGAMLMHLRYVHTEASLTVRA